MIKLITDNDLDGISCYIVLKTLCPDEEIKVTFCKSYSHVNDLVLRALEHPEAYDKLYITDLSVTEYVANKIEVVNDDNHILLFDHHKTATWLNNYTWANVSVDRKMKNGEVKKCCGSEIFKDFLCLVKDVKNKALDEYIELVRRYDTWEWKTKYDDMIPSDLNLLYKIKGRSAFMNSILQSVNDNIPLFSQLDIELINIERRRINDYVAIKNNDIITFKILNYNVGVLFAEQYISELGNRLCELHPELDVIAMIGQKAISYRTIKDNVDVSEIAKRYGGGGHKSAAGSLVKKSQLRKVMRSLLFIKE